MKIAIHPDAGRYTDRWIEYCKANGIDYKIVNCHQSDIIEQLEDCDGLMWNWNQNNYRSALMAKQLTVSIEASGKKVFPNNKSTWHFEDKVGQKYLLEAVDAPLVKSYVFYSKKTADEWIESTSFPKVFKLRNGAASINVKLARTKEDAKALVNQAFGKGFSQNNRWGRLADKVWVLKRDKNFEALKGVFKGIGRLFILTELAKFTQKEKGYVYFQDFADGNNFDTRIHVVGNKCVGLRRYVRGNDFRASGSGVKDYNPELIDKRCLQIVFDISKRLQLQSAAFDFIYVNDEPKIVEICYTSLVGPFYNDCPGYWDPQLQFHPATVNLEYYMIEDFLASLRK